MSPEGDNFLITRQKTMKTPAGKECSYFYGDYYRGRNHEECRLLKESSTHPTWTPDLCSTCPVPGIQMANACPNMILDASVDRPFPFVKRKVKVTAYCILSKQVVKEPHVGCGQCHPLPDIFNQEGK